MSKQGRIGTKIFSQFSFKFSVDISLFVIEEWKLRIAWVAMLVKYSVTQLCPLIDKKFVCKFTLKYQTDLY